MLPINLPKIVLNLDILESYTEEILTRLIYIEFYLMLV